jgi:hypothetical protein
MLTTKQKDACKRMFAALERAAPALRHAMTRARTNQQKAALQLAAQECEESLQHGRSAFDTVEG